MSPDLLFEVKDRVAFLTINREDRRNAISQEMILSFLDRLEEIDKDDAVARAFSEAVRKRQSGTPTERLVLDEFQTFLLTLRLEDVKRLGL